MTGGELQKLGETVSLATMPFVVGLDVVLTPRAVQVTVRMRVKERDSGQPIYVHYVEQLVEELLVGLTREGALRLFLRVAEDAIRHELHECFLVDGQRIYDPHRNERRARGEATG